MNTGVTTDSHITKVGYSNSCGRIRYRLRALGQNKAPALSYHAHITFFFSFFKHTKTCIFLVILIFIIKKIFVLLPKFPMYM